MTLAYASAPGVVLLGVAVAARRGLSLGWLRPRARSCGARSAP